LILPEDGSAEDGGSHFSIVCNVVHPRFYGLV
jgi:hypothetical protein